MRRIFNMFRQGLGNANSPAEDNTPAVPGDNDPAPNDDTTEPDNIVKRALIENGGKGPVQRHSIARAKLLAENARAPETTADTVPRAGELTLFGDTIWFRREEREAMVPQLNGTYKFLLLLRRNLNNYQTMISSWFSGLLLHISSVIVLPTPMPVKSIPMWLLAQSNFGKRSVSSRSVVRHGNARFSPRTPFQSLENCIIAI